MAIVFVQQQNMRFKERDASSKRKYSKISITKRMKLIELVINQRESLIKTTKKLNINLSTSRLILKGYRQNGAFNMKNFKHPPKEDHLSLQIDRKIQIEDFAQNNLELVNKVSLQQSKQQRLRITEDINSTAFSQWQYYWVYYLSPFFIDGSSYF